MCGSVEFEFESDLEFEIQSELELDIEASSPDYASHYHQLPFLFCSFSLKWLDFQLKIEPVSF